MLQKSHHQRRSIRLKEYDYSESWWYFVTICTYNKQNLCEKIINGKMVLAKYGKIVEEELLQTKEASKNIELNYHVIMPNHIHIIIIIESWDTARCVPTEGPRKFGKVILDYYR